MKTDAVPLAKETTDIVNELKTIWRTFNEMLQQNKLKVPRSSSLTQKGEDSNQAMTQIKDMLHRIEITWVKLERNGARMVKSFNSVTRESSGGYDSISSQKTMRSKK